MSRWVGTLVSSFVSRASSCCRSVSFKFAMKALMRRIWPGSPKGATSQSILQPRLINESKNKSNIAEMASFYQSCYRQKKDRVKNPERPPGFLTRPLKHLYFRNSAAFCTTSIPIKRARLPPRIFFLACVVNCG